MMAEASASKAGDGASGTDGKMTDHQALQIVSVDLESNEVTVNMENLKIIEDNLAQMGVEKVSVVSVMGAYRTGKSFLLDLFLRYLEHDGSKG